MDKLSVALGAIAGALFTCICFISYAVYEWVMTRKLTAETDHMETEMKYCTHLADEEREMMKPTLPREWNNAKM